MLIIGFSAGIVYGLVTAIVAIHSHEYMAQKMYRLALYTSTGAVNRGVLLGLIAASSFIGLWFLKRIIMINVIGTQIDVRITNKKDMRPVLKSVSYLVFLGIGVFFITKAILNPGDLRFLVIALLIEIALFLAIQTVFTNKMAVIQVVFRSMPKNCHRHLLVGLFAVGVVINAATVTQNFLIYTDGPNILIVLPDSLRPDHLGFNGYERQTSPNIDCYATESITFNQAYSSSPWTKPAIGAMLTSSYPYVHRAFHWKASLPNRNLTLAEILRNKNYKTVSFQSNSVVRSRYNFNQGFQKYYEMTYDPGENVTRKFYDWLKNNKTKSFFAYLHYMDTHYPFRTPEDYEPSFKQERQSALDLEELTYKDIRLMTKMGMPKSDRDYMINAYDDSIRYFDKCFGQLIKGLRDAGILERTIVVLVSDHGEEFWDHDSFGHGHTLYREVMQVALMIRYPLILNAKQVNHPVNLLDLVPTLLPLAGINSKVDFTGENLLPLILHSRPSNKALFMEGILNGAEKKGILRDGWKLIKNTDIKFNMPELDLLGKLTEYMVSPHAETNELYWIEEDPNEHINLFFQQKESHSELRSRLQSFFINSFTQQNQGESRPAKKLEDLRSLGYIR